MEKSFTARVAMDLRFSWGSDDERTTSELAATTVVAPQEIVHFNSEAPSGGCSPSREKTPTVVETSTQLKKSKKAHDEKDKAWVVYFNPILPTHSCVNDLDLAKRIINRSRNRTDVKLAESRSMDEAVDEISLSLYRLHICY